MPPPVLLAMKLLLSSENQNHQIPETSRPGQSLEHPKPTGENESPVFGLECEEWHPATFSPCPHPHGSVFQNMLFPPGLWA